MVVEVVLHKRTVVMFNRELFSQNISNFFIRLRQQNVLKNKDEAS